MRNDNARIGRSRFVALSLCEWSPKFHARKSGYGTALLQDMLNKTQGTPDWLSSQTASHRVKSRKCATLRKLVQCVWAFWGWWSVDVDGMTVVEWQTNTFTTTTTDTGC